MNKLFKIFIKYYYWYKIGFDIHILLNISETQLLYDVLLCHVLIERTKKLYILINKQENYFPEV